MTTPRNRAIYFAKQAFALMQMRGLSAGLIRLETEDGARWSFTHDESGFVVILKHAANHAHGGAVDAARTKTANAKPAPAEEPAPAAVLRNGAEVLARVALAERPGNLSAELVLCRLPDNDATPFVTWQRNTADGGLYWGHYFTEESEAREDFKARARGRT